MAVQAALSDGRLDQARFDSWGKLQRELEHQQLKHDPLARSAQRREWITVMKAARIQMRGKRKGPD